MSCFELQALLPGMKKEKTFLKEANSRSLQHAVIHLIRAYIN
jgi:hypothetical protein